jgi:hypothetical protein
VNRRYGKKKRVDVGKTRKQRWRNDEGAQHQCGVSVMVRHLKLWQKSQTMKAIAIIVATCALSALALPSVRPTLPPVGHADAEATTNVSFTAWQENAGRFTFSLTCRTTPTNNVQAAFGTDADNDGILSLEECDLVVGWDCGAWFVQNGFDGERVESITGAGDEQTLVWTATLSPRTGISKRIDATVGVTAVFGGVDAGMFYNRTWNMLRLTGRGLSDSGESLDVRVLPDSLFMVVR